jgi:uncharacterized RDD family membrane protein YckC
MPSHPEPQMDKTGTVIKSRVFASVIDFTLLGLLTVAVVLIGSMGGESVFLLLSVIWAAVSIVYLFLLEGLFGYTLGKFLCGLVVVSADGSACTLRGSIQRNLLWVIDGLGGALVGVTFMLLTDHGQRLDDVLAETVVTKQQ